MGSATFPADEPLRLVAVPDRNGYSPDSTPAVGTEVLRWVARGWVVMCPALHHGHRPTARESVWRAALTGMQRSRRTPHPQRPTSRCQMLGVCSSRMRGSAMYVSPIRQGAMWSYSPFPIPFGMPAGKRMSHGPQKMRSRPAGHPTARARALPTAEDVTGSVALTPGARYRWHVAANTYANRANDKWPRPRSEPPGSRRG